MLEFLTLKPNSFGLEVSNSFIRIINFKKKRKFLTLSSWGEFRIPSGLFDNGEVKNEKALSEEIKRAVSSVKGEKIKTNYVASCLPEKNAFLQVIQIPKMEKNELKSAVFFEAENHIPFSTSEVYLDFEVISNGESSDRLNVLLAALPKKKADPYINCLKKAGLRPYSLEIEPYTLARSLVKKGEDDEPVLLLNFGGNSTLFAIFLKGAVRFSTTSNISSSSLTKAISESLKISNEKAEEIKIDNNPEAEKAMEPVISKLIEETAGYIDYYQAHSDLKVKKIILSGKGAALKGFEEKISEALKIPSEIGNPWVNIPIKDIPPIDFENSLSFATALGLALRRK